MVSSRHALAKPRGSGEATQCRAGNGVITCTVTEVIPEKKVAFWVDINGLTWSYELQPTERGTRVIESRHAESGAKPLANFAVNAFFGGVPRFERELVEGMNTSLARIKATAEITAPSARPPRRQSPAPPSDPARPRTRTRPADPRFTIQYESPN